MPQLDLRSLFESLAPPVARSEDTLAVTATPIPGLDAHRVGKDSEGAPVVLVGVVDGIGRSPPPVRLENLSVAHRVRCRIWHDDRLVEEGTFTVIRCPAQDEPIRQYFLRVAVPFLLSLGNSPSASQVSHLVDALVELFRALAEPARKSVQGLWAELFLLEESSDLRLLAQAWHPGPAERYDFSFGAQRIEVKSVSGRVRRHTFSLEQLQPPAMTTVMIASVLMERTGGGTSLGDLIERARSRLTAAPDLLLRLDSVVALTLGEGLPGALDERYDEELARESLAFFQAEAIPKPKGEMPREVSEVRFVVDLSGLTPVDLTLYTGAGGLFRAAVPR